MELDLQHPLAVAVVQAIQRGDVESLADLLTEHPALAGARIRHGPSSRSLLHVATDWPGHPRGAEVVAILVAAGADVDARLIGPHAETPLHWAASSDDVEVLDALLDAGADIEAPGAVIGGGSPLCDAVGFGQWKAARRLVERGARTTLWQAAALGLTDRIEEEWAKEALPREGVSRAFWSACHGGQQRAAEHLLRRGADLNWIPWWERRNPLDAAEREGHHEMVTWLRDLGAKSARERTD